MLARQKKFRIAVEILAVGILRLRERWLRGALTALG
jgi:hypothetical protein